MILIATDFGYEAPYMGQMHTACLVGAPGVAIVDLCADLPAFSPQCSAYLLAAWMPHLQERHVLLGVVDPGVGGERNPIIVQIGDLYCVGPDNGLFALLARQRGDASWWRIDWRPEHLSSSFHGRDLFAPVAAGLARGMSPEDFGSSTTPVNVDDWPDDLDLVLYIDRYGNAMTGRRASTLPPDTVYRIGEVDIPPAATFCETEPGLLFWYENSSGLVEIAAREASAAQILNLFRGTPITIVR